MQPDESLQERLAQYRDVPGGLLPLLHAIQEDHGHIPGELVPDIARAMSLSRAEVHGVISFYEDFRSAPVGRHVLKICRAEACQAMGSRALENHARSRLALDYGETTTDGQLTLLPVYCLGNCACSPSIQLDGELHARVGPRTLDTLLDKLADDEAGAG